jgi:hypothetical protein
MITFSLKLRLVWLASGSRASSSWLVIANELKSWLGYPRYHNKPSRAEPSQPRAERANELRVFRPALPPVDKTTTVWRPVQRAPRACPATLTRMDVRHQHIILSSLTRNSDTCFFFALLHQDVWFYRPFILPISPFYFHIFHISVFYLNSTICRACVAFLDCATPARERQGQIKINLRRGQCTEDAIFFEPGSFAPHSHAIARKYGGRQVLNPG